MTLTTIDPIGQAYLGRSVASSGPWWIHAELVFDHRLDGDLIERAALELIEHVPETRLQLAPNRREWRVRPLTGGPAPQLELAELPKERDVDDYRDRLLSTPSDPSNDPTVRIVGLSTPGASRALLLVDHAVMDGIAVMQLTRQLLRRIFPTLPLREPTVRLARQPVVTMDARDAAAIYRPVLARRPATLAWSEQGVGLVGQRVATRSCGMRMPQGCRVSPNDVLIAAVHAAIGTWNAARKRQGGDACGDAIGVAVPVTLRPAFEQRAYGNAVVLMPTRSEAEARSDPHTLVRAIVDQTKMFRLGPFSPVIGHLGSRMAQGVWPMWARQVVGETTVLSSVGGTIDALEIGARVGLTGVLGSMPPGPSMPAALAAFRSSAEQVVVCCRYRRRCWSAADAREFLSTLGRELGAITTALERAA